MKRKLISSLVLSSIIAFGVQAEDFTGSIYIKDATIAPGGTATLSVQLENNIDVAGFQFDMKLPEGISYSSWGLSEERLPSGATTSDCAKSQSFENQIFKCAMALSYGAGAAYTGTSGEVAIITIDADAAAAEGTYTVELENVVVGFPSNANVKIAGTSFTLTVKTPTFEEGYAVEILPFAFTGAANVSKSIIMANKTAITNIAFDVEVPSYFTDNNLCRTTFDFDEWDFSTGAVISSNEIHITVDAEPGCSIAEGNENVIVNLGIRKNTGATAGVYPVTIKNIELTDVDGKSYLAAPYTTEIFVGDAPKATVTDGVTAFHGNYGGADEYALLTSALPEGAMIDLTEVSAMAEDPTTLKKNNVIVTADAVAYSRTLPNAWGTLCLPFAIETDDNIQLYEFTRATSTGLFFEKITSAAANTPLIFKATGDVSFKIPNDGTFEVGYANLSPNLTPSVDNWVVNGSYIDETVDVSSMQAYALYEGEFRRATSRINVKAFHAWLQNNGEPMGAAIRISEGTDGIDIIEQEDGSIKLIYDMQGRQLKNGEGQQIYIENGKKVISINN